MTQYRFPKNKGKQNNKDNQSAGFHFNYWITLLMNIPVPFVESQEVQSSFARLPSKNFMCCVEFIYQDILHKLSAWHKKTNTLMIFFCIPFFHSKTKATCIHAQNIINDRLHMPIKNSTIFKCGFFLKQHTLSL